VPPPPPALVKAQPGLKKGDRFYQEVVVSRQSACRALGVDFRDAAQYAFVSSFEVEQAGEDGLRVVRQKVEAVRLDRAEPAGRARLNGLLQKTRGATFRITLGPGGEVLKLEGEKTPLAVSARAAVPGEMAFLLQSVMDLDGWKELAQLTFFRPPKKLPEGGRWSRKLTHGWGSLGSWAGQVTFRQAGKAGGLERFDYQLALKYVPPRGGGGGLPFAVSKADFRLQAGGGSIAFDPARGRVAAAEERFHVRGVLEARALGATSAVEVEEVQHFRVRVLDRLPTEK
jgi:hypothetical protein